MKTVFIAFYSFKGGVGRSLALANLGWVLASRGKRVVLVDMDLEAPGLPGLKELAPPEGPPVDGVVELAQHYAVEGEVPPLAGHYYEARFTTGHGRLWVVPAGRMDADYQQTFARLDWSALHREKGSDGFVEGFRGRIREALQPHYVLIDSRTGFSDVSGLTTHRLADQVALVFNLTRTCLEGTVRAYRSMTDRDKPPRIFLVASPVPAVAAEEGTVISQRLDDAGTLMSAGLRSGQEIVRLEYDARMVLAERLAVTAPKEFPLAARYEAFCDSILKANPDEVLQQAGQARELIQTGRVKHGLKTLREFVASHVDDADGHLALGRLLLSTGHAAEARDAFQGALAVHDDLAEAHRGLGEALLALAEAGAGDGPKELSTAMNADAKTGLNHLRRASELAPASTSIRHRLASALLSVSGPDRALRVRESLPHWEVAASDPLHGLEDAAGWGFALLELAQLANHPLRGQYREKAQAVFERILAFLPDDSNALVGCGALLAEKAKDEQGQGRERLARQACQYYERVSEVEAADWQLLDLWANALLLLVSVSDGDEALQLATQAARKARAANQLDPGSGDYNLACALSRLGDFDEAEPLLLASLDRKPSLRPHALADEDFQLLFGARPALRDRIAADLPPPSTD